MLDDDACNQTSASTCRRQLPAALHYCRLSSNDNKIGSENGNVLTEGDGRKDAILATSENLYGDSLEALLEKTIGANASWRRGRHLATATMFTTATDTSQNKSDKTCIWSESSA